MSHSDNPLNDFTHPQMGDKRFLRPEFDDFGSSSAGTEKEANKNVVTDQRIDLFSFGSVS